MTEHADLHRQNAASQQLLVDSQRESFPYVFSFNGLNIRVDKGVFSPKYFNGWRIFTNNFPTFTNKTILEIGTATGISALYLAREGAKHVTAVDINKAAVENARANVELNNIQNMDVRLSDIFSGIQAHETFDIIYWNTPFGYVDEDYIHENMLERSIFDPGYRIIEQFLSKAPAYLENNGFVLTGTGSGADLNRFHEIVRKTEFKSELITIEESEEIFPVDFQLYKLTI